MLLATKASWYSPFIEAFHYSTKRKKSAYSLCPVISKLEFSLRIYSQKHTKVDVQGYSYRCTRIFLSVYSTM